MFEKGSCRTFIFQKCQDVRVELWLLISISLMRRQPIRVYVYVISHFSQCEGLALFFSPELIKVLNNQYLMSVCKVGFGVSGSSENKKQSSG